MIGFPIILTTCFFVSASKPQSFNVVRLDTTEHFQVKLLKISPKTAWRKVRNRCDEFHFFGRRIGRVRGPFLQVFKVVVGSIMCVLAVDANQLASPKTYVLTMKESINQKREQVWTPTCRTEKCACFKSCLCDEILPKCDKVTAVRAYVTIVGFPDIS